MTFQEKGNWLYAIVILATYVTYVGIILGRAGDGSITEVSYVSTMLWAIGISIALNIIGSIAIAISKPSEADKTDERDKQINRFGEYVGGMVVGFAMLVPLGLAMTESAYFWISNAIYTAFVLSSLVSSTVKIVAYRRGF